MSQNVYFGTGQAMEDSMGARHSLLDGFGRRKYLTKKECQRFQEVAENEPPPKRLFAILLLLTGCRISEALELDPTRIDLEEILVTFRTLKQRRDDVFRSVPGSKKHLTELADYFDFPNHKGRLWKINRRTGYRWIRDIMTKAQIQGIHASPKGLRHSFGVACVEEGEPISLIQRWMGHARLATTMIYLQIVGEEERKFIRRVHSRYGY